MTLTVTLLWYPSSCNRVENYRSCRWIVIFTVTPKVLLYPKHVYVKNALLQPMYVILYLYFVSDISQAALNLPPNHLSQAMNICSDTKFGKLHYINNHESLRVIHPTGNTCRLFDHFIQKGKSDFARCIHFQSIPSYLRDRASLEQRYKQPTRCNNFRLLIYLNLLYLFRATNSPISRSIFDCIHRFGTTHRYCCQPVTRFRWN